MMEGRITLVVKAANQSVPDQRVECDSQWTVFALKGHLSTAHPSKPRVEEQRLIYSGQLLLDDLLLRNVLRHPTENNAYIVHLVCSPPRQPSASSSTQPTGSPARQQSLPHRTSGTTTPTRMTVPQQEGSTPSRTPTPPVETSVTDSTNSTTTTTTSTEGLRRRNVNISSENATDTTHQGIDASAAGYPTQAQVSMSTILQATADPIQQMVTMQQMYANYMAYMQYIQMGGGLAAGGVPWPHQQMLHHMSASPSNSTSSVQQSTVSVAEQNDQQPQQQQAADQNALPNQPQPQAQQPPQIRMNAQGGEVDDDDENEGLGRDWLDWIYVLSRMVVLLFIVYFYSNVYRFLVVVCIALLLYLYQAGWFRPTRRPAEQQQQHVRNENDVQDDHNNNINNNNNNNEVPEQLLMGNNNNNPDEETDDEEDEVSDPPPRQARQGNEAAAGGRAGTDQNVEVDVRPSLLALSWTFVTTFFTSLIPEQPQVI